MKLKVPFNTYYSYCYSIILSIIITVITILITISSTILAGKDPLALIGFLGLESKLSKSVDMLFDLEYPMYGETRLCTLHNVFTFVWVKGVALDPKP